MIFLSRNESGVPAWKLVLEGKKDVTRRLKPEPVGAIRAVQPNRAEKAICKIKIMSCVAHQAWWAETIAGKSQEEAKIILDKEAKREGFKTWESLVEWFDKKGIRIEDTHRIEFELVNNGH